jgi:hypothetical protein
MIDTSKLKQLLSVASPLPWQGSHNAGIGVTFPDLTWSGNHGDYWKLKDAELLLEAVNSLPGLLDRLERLEGLHSLIMMRHQLDFHDSEEIVLAATRVDE